VQGPLAAQRPGPRGARSTGCATPWPTSGPSSDRPSWRC
jgi:hypothetical protein